MASEAKGDTGAVADREPATPPTPLDESAALRNKADELMRKAASGDLSDDESRWIQDVSRLSEIRSRLPQARNDRWFVSPALVALACVVVAGLLMLLRVGDLPAIGFLATNDVSLHVRSSGIAVTLAGSPDPNIVGPDRPIVTTKLAISPLNTITVSNSSLALHQSSPVLRADLTSERAYIDEIRLSTPAVVDVRAANGQIVVRTDAEHLQVSATFDHAEFSEPFSERVKSDEELDIPLFARFETANAQRSGLEIRLSQDGPINILEGRRISDLEFADQYVVGGDTLTYLSTIRSGSLILNDVSRTIEIHNRDGLVLEGLDAWITDLTIDDGVMDLFIKGTVRSIRAGPGGNGTDLSPRLLEHFARNQPFTLFWGSMVFLWGLAAGVIRRIRGE